MLRHLESPVAMMKVRSAARPEMARLSAANGHPA